ncbi:hypothetical protein QR680_015842 [Steinernema hermaphroditum]|uniref:EF-hand domain-containing protein n=1 Tax=Steinernema hermaphroditum TaxID=289476 RepID=A0AA39LKX0_9BILA|nr:hypothetical protein QR680_015842 [Steinernema hermaphroditum]
MGSCIRKAKNVDIKKDKSRFQSLLQDMEKMWQLFKEFDTNGDGFIQKSELKEAMIKTGQSPTNREVGDIFDAADANNDGRIDFSEFLAIARSANIEILRDVFYEIDVNHDGFITKDELQDALQKMGHFLSDEDAEVIFEIVDSDKDDRIDFQEFRHMMVHASK